jgi:hypothetical protein
LADNELILPHFENRMLADNWPDSYTITIDSSPYYGAGDGYFHPSTHPLMGARELYYRFHPDTRDHVIRERRSLQSHMTLAMGSALHGVVQTQFEMAGLVRPENIEVEYVNHEHHVRGRIDFIVDHPNGQSLVVEMKTQNSFGFKNQKTIKPAWDAQLSLALDHQGLDTGVLLLVDPGRPAGLNFEDALSATAASIGNVGPGFGMVGPMGSYAPFSDQAKIFLSLLMVVGRLEIFPVLVLLTSAFWRD